MSPVRCGAVTVRDGRAKRDGDGGGGGGGGGRAFTLLFLSPLRTVSRRYEYVQSIFFHFSVRAVLTATFRAGLVGRRLAPKPLPPTAKGLTRLKTIMYS
jgi:hypothetical protein